MRFPRSQRIAENHDVLFYTPPWVRSTDGLDTDHGEEIGLVLPRSPLNIRTGAYSGTPCDSPPAQPHPTPTEPLREADV